MSKKRVIIIGAGPAGLTAAYELLKRAGDFFEVVVLEAGSFVGGLAQNFVHNGKILDIGGHRFFSKNDIIHGWWGNIMPLQGSPAPDDILLERKKEYRINGADPQKTDEVMLVRNHYSRIMHKDKFLRYPFDLSLRKLGIGASLHVGSDYFRSRFSKRKEETLEDFYKNYFGEALYAILFEEYAEKVWGKHPAEISADLREFCTGDFSEKNFLYPKFGPGQFWDKVSEEIQRMGGILVTDCRVTGLVCGGRKAKTAECMMLDGENEIQGDVFISTMPVSDLVCQMKGVGVPQIVAQTALGLPYRELITVGIEARKVLIPKEPKIKSFSGVSPDCWVYLQDSSLKAAKIQIYNNWSPYLLPNPEQSAWIAAEYFCNKGDMIWNNNEIQMQNFAARELEKAGILNRGDIRDMCCVKVQRACPSYYGAYENFFVVRQYLDEFSNLFCIGRNGQHRCYHMDQAMMTAIEAVSNILTGQENRSNIWNN